MNKHCYGNLRPKLIHVMVYPLFMDYGVYFQGYTKKQHPVIRSSAPKRVLVTGAAGFIGFHLTRVLAQNKDNVIVGIDNYNDYYDVKLKIVSALSADIWHFILLFRHTSANCANCMAGS